MEQWAPEQNCPIVFADTSTRVYKCSSRPLRHMTGRYICPSTKHPGFLRRSRVGKLTDFLRKEVISGTNVVSNCSCRLKLLLIIGYYNCLFTLYYVFLNIKRNIQVFLYKKTIIVQQQSPYNYKFFENRSVLMFGVMWCKIDLLIPS